MAAPGEVSDNGHTDTEKDERPFCNLPAEKLDAEGCVPSEVLEQLDLATCRLKPDACFTVEAPAPSLAPWLRRVPKKVPLPKRKVVSVMEEKHPAPVVAPDHVLLPVPPVSADAPAPVATVGVPDNALADIQKLIPAGGDASMVTVLLAVVGVAGGGAAFKFYRSWQKSRHEQEMKKLEIEEKKAEKQDDKHEACNAARAALEARVASLEGQLSHTVAALEQKIAEVQKTTSSGGPVALGDFDPEELEDRLKKDEDRLKKLEKALKPTSAPKTKR